MSDFLSHLIVIVALVACFFLASGLLSGGNSGQGGEL